MLITRAFLYTTFRVPSKGAPSSRLPLQRAHRKRRSVSRDFLQLSLRDSDEWTPLIIHLSLKVPGKSAPSVFSNKVPVDRDTPSPEPMAYSSIYIPQSLYLASPPTKTRKTQGHGSRSPTWT